MTSSHTGKQPAVNGFAARHKTLSNLQNNSRFYILAFSFLLSLAVLALLRLRFVGDQLFYIRTEQAYGFISLGFVYIALIISPVSKLFKTYKFVDMLQFSRRAIGVSAAYFALLHTVVATWGQLGGINGVNLAPDRYKVAFTYGLTMLVILLIMAATSFDKVVSYLTLPRWKMIHRLVYVGGVLVIAHVWMIGTHLAYGWVQKTTFGLLVILFGLESYRMAAKAGKKFPLFRKTAYAVLFFAVMWAGLTAALWNMPKVFKSFHSEHAATSGESHSEPTQNGATQ